nr:hypothetical protein [Pseudomonas allii]
MAEAAPIREQQTLPLADCDGRVLAQDLVSTLDLPPWPNSAMDGYAVRLSDWTGEPLVVSQRIFAGQAPQPLAAGTCARIFTGAPVPEGADCVEMQETPWSTRRARELHRAPAPRPEHPPPGPGNHRWRVGLVGRYAPGAD